MQKALAFIDRNALRKIGVPDVAAHLKVSPSLLSLRFRELQHESVYAAITRVRLDEVKRRLRATHAPIEKISADCGWDNVNVLKNLFKRHEGVSMRAWRNGAHGIINPRPPRKETCACLFVTKGGVSNIRSMNSRDCASGPIRTVVSRIG